MGMGPIWTEQEKLQLGFLIHAGFKYKEIAAQMKRPLTGVSRMAWLNFGGNPNYINSKTKHKHLREQVMRYFTKHTAIETQKNFKLTEIEFKSLMTVGYMDPKFAHIRKDKRDHSPWTAKQEKFLLCHAGLRPRRWIAEQLGRCNEVGIKERLTLRGVSSRTLNGVTLSSYRQAFCKEPRVYVVTDAGPGRGKYNATFFKITPWVQVKKDLDDKYISTSNVAFLRSIECMAMFQEWIFEGNALKKIKRIVAKIEAAKC